MAVPPLAVNLPFFSDFAILTKKMVKTSRRSDASLCRDTDAADSGKPNHWAVLENALDCRDQAQP